MGCGKRSIRPPTPATRAVPRKGPGQGVEGPPSPRGGEKQSAGSWQQGSAPTRRFSASAPRVGRGMVSRPWPPDLAAIGRMECEAAGRYDEAASGPLMRRIRKGREGPPHIASDRPRYTHATEAISYRLGCRRHNHETPPSPPSRPAATSPGAATLKAGPGTTPPTLVPHHASNPNGADLGYHFASSRRHRASMARTRRGAVPPSESLLLTEPSTVSTE